MSKEKTKKHGIKQVIKNVHYMLKYAYKYTPAYILVTFGEAFGRGAWHIFNVLFLKYLFDALEANEPFANILFWALLHAGYCAIFECFNKWRLNVYVPRAKLILHEGIQNELYDKARELDQSCYDNPEFYNDFIWAIRESDQRVAQIMENHSIFINRIFSSLAILGVLASIDWIVAIILLFSVALLVFVGNKRNNAYYERSVECNPINRKLGYICRVFYLPEYAKEIRSGNIANHMHNEYDKTTKEKISVVKKHMGKIFAFSLLGNIIYDTFAHVGVMSYLIIRFVVDSTLSLGDFSGSINATFKLGWALNDLARYFNIFNEHSLYIEKVRSFVNYTPTIKGDIAQIPNFEKLTIKNLKFKYPFSKDAAYTLNNIDLEIKKGEKIAFVGYNGAGKTTLTMLLMRLYDASEGEILWNEKNINNFAPESYREHIGAVFQDYKIFAAKLTENVLGGEYHLKDESRVIEALNAASFSDKLKELTDGINSELTTEFSKSGVGLSGGESQKIAIARVFAKPYELIIMDEPSSALDPIAEYELNQSILKNAENKTVIFISHRLSTTQMADRIYMFGEGKIIESGSHNELMSLNGKYAEMYKIQAQKYSILN